KCLSQGGKQVAVLLARCVAVLLARRVAARRKFLGLFDRLTLFGMPAKHQPDFIYLRHVPLRKVLALVFIRKLMDCIFTKREMSWLDDLMPESKKKKLEDADEEEEQSILAEDEGVVQVPLEGYKGYPSSTSQTKCQKALLEYLECKRLRLLRKNNDFRIL
ncbi:unnamed protein product, partial [Pleuronectes platessa]